jgi:hypothetical protein
MKHDIKNAYGSVEVSFMLGPLYQKGKETLVPLG